MNKERMKRSRTNRPAPLLHSTEDLCKSGLSLASTGVKYHDNLKVLIQLNHWLALTMLDGATRPETLFHNPLVKHFSRGAAVWTKFPLSPNRVHQNVTLLGRTPSSCFHVLFLSQQHNRRPANDHHIHAMSGKMWVVTHSDRLKQATQKWTGHYYRLIFLTTPLPSHSISKYPLIPMTHRIQSRFLLGEE